jgi:hypothetical protein
VSADVLAHGDDRPPGRTRGVLVGVAAVVALVTVGVVARSGGGTPRPAASPSASPTPDGVPGGVEDVVPVATYDRSVTVGEPPAGGVLPVLLTRREPGFLVRDAVGSYHAYSALGGPDYAQVVVGWCSTRRSFQDPAAAYGYAVNGQSYDGLPSLVAHPVRSAGAGRHEIGDFAGPDLRGTSRSARPRPCPDRLVMPPLPPRVTTLTQTQQSYGLMDGRLFVTTETRAFCERTAARGCAAAGWENNGLPVLPPGDLAGAYTYEGDFVAHADPTTGEFFVGRLPEARLVRREFVGATVRVGFALDARDVSGVPHLYFDPYRYESGTPPDDSPPGPPRSSHGRSWLTDVRGGVRDYAVRGDVQVFIGAGVTGLGLPRGTAVTLRDFVRDGKAEKGPPLWVVLDARGRVLRVVADPG